MTKIISATELVRNFKDYSEELSEQAIVATKNGRGNVVILPYFDGCDKKIAEYMEDYEMIMSKENLEGVYQKYLESGESDLKV
jgi:hypothetical protein